MNVSERIKAVERYFGPVEASKRLGINKGTWWRWRTGKMAPTKAHTAKINQMLGGLKAKGKIRPIYKTSKVNALKTVKTEMQEYNKDIEPITVSGSPKKPKSKAQMLKQIEHILRYQMLYNKEFRANYERVFKAFNRRGHKDYDNSLICFDLHNLKGERSGGATEEKVNDLTASINLIQGVYRKWQEALETQVEDMISTYRDLLHYWDKLSITFTRFGVKTYRYLKV